MSLLTAAGAPAWHPAHKRLVARSAAAAAHCEAAGVNFERLGMAFAAATAVGEFAVTLFLSRPEWATLSTLIYQHLGRPGAANLDAALVLACALMALALAVFLLIEWPGSDPANPEGHHA